MDANQQKKLAAEKAVEEIKSGMIIGLGTGSTVQFALEKISEKLKSGELKNIYGIPSSLNTEKEARRLGILLITLDEALERSETAKVKSETRNGNKKSEIRNQKSASNAKNNSQPHLPADKFSISNSQLFIDLTIDGADEFAVGNHDPDLSGEGLTRINLIKGGGGALLREKILAQASERLIIITDESKRSKYLGEKWPVPVEVIQMAFAVEKKFLEGLGAAVKVRKTSEGNYYITDEGNFIIDANFGIMKDVKKIAEQLNNRAGIVEHGIFLGLADKVICALSNGSIEEIGRNNEK
ncbi:MAG: ribose 5-phosphate isomerase A [Bacteroidetes bacterium]|nr:ribose 5-phosphate isomerase A [Bacteroidota bacterium]